MQYTTTNKKGSITIYLSLVLCLIISIILSITELSRMRLNRLYLQTAVNTSLDSMLSLYNKKLWDYYRVFGVDYKNKQLLKTEYESYLKPFLYDENNEKLNNWYVSNYISENSNLDISCMTDSINFENEALEYMKLLLPGKVISMFNKNIKINDIQQINNIYDEVLKQKEEYEKNEIFEEVDIRYFDFEEQVNALEKYSKIINEKVALLNDYIKSNRNISVSKNKKTARKIIQIVTKINDYVDIINENIKNFISQMDIFREKVIESEQLFENDVSSNKHNFNDSTINFIKDEFIRFKEYVDENNEMNQKARALSNELDDNVNDLKEYEVRFTEILSEIESLEMTKKAILSEKYEGYSEDIKAINEEIKSLNEEIYEYGKVFRDELISLEFTEPNILTSNGVRQDLIDSLKKFLKFKEDILLKLCMTEADYEKLDKSNIKINDINILSSGNLLNKILFSEYIFNMFNFHNKYKLKEKTLSKSEMYEVERILYGHNSDIQNIKSVVYRLLIIREGLNLLYLYTDNNKRELARNFAYIHFGALTPVVAEVVFILLLSAWAFAQAITDVKNLLDNNKVMFFHNSESFNFDIEDIFSIAGGKLTDNDMKYQIKDNDLALNYKDYLRLLMMATQQNTLNSRAISIIQYNISKEQQFFNIEKSIFSFNADIEFESNNIFNKIIFLDDFKHRVRENYKIKINSYASY